MTDIVDRLRASNAMLMEALDEIVNPISYMRKRAAALGGVLNDSMALNIANSAAHLQSIARAAIAKAEEIK